MSRYNKLPFQRGKTAYQNNSDDLTVTTLAHLEGQTVYLPNSAAATPETRRNGKDVVAVIVRNVEGSAIAAGTAVQWKTGYHGTRVEAADGGAEKAVAGFVDDHIGSNGVQNNDLFYMIVEGPVVAVTKDGTAHTGTIYKEGFRMFLSSVSGKIEGFAGADGSLKTTASAPFNSVGRVLTTAEKDAGTVLLDAKII